MYRFRPLFYRQYMLSAASLMENEDFEKNRNYDNDDCSQKKASIAFASALLAGNKNRFTWFWRLQITLVMHRGASAVAFPARIWRKVSAFLISRGRKILRIACGGAHMLAIPTCLFECYIALARDVAGLNIVDGGLSDMRRLTAIGRFCGGRVRQRLLVGSQRIVALRVAIQSVVNIAHITP